MSSALNLDGGGSSALWSRKHRIINRPSDKVAFIRIPRKVGNAVLVVPANSATN
ncbi:MAG: phosphodiester glycosidase family protein [Alistipes indistinctus]